MNWPVAAKIALSVVGLGMAAVATTYQLNPQAPAMAYVAAACGAVGAYLIGLFQERPLP